MHKLTPHGGSKQPNWGFAYHNLALVGQLRGAYPGHCDRTFACLNVLAKDLVALATRSTEYNGAMAKAVHAVFNARGVRAVSSLAYKAKKQIRYAHRGCGASEDPLTVQILECAASNLVVVHGSQSCTLVQLLGTALQEADLPNRFKQHPAMSSKHAENLHAGWIEVLPQIS